jgi:hypothetical protein
MRTTGAFRGDQDMRRREFPDTKIAGILSGYPIFITRRAPEAVDVEDFET